MCRPSDLAADRHTAAYQTAITDDDLIILDGMLPDLDGVEVWSFVISTRQLIIDFMNNYACSQWLLGAAALLLSASDVLAQTGAPLTLGGALDRALAANPTIVAARLRQGVALAGVNVAREFLNPEARVELDRETPRQSYGFALPIEMGGKRSRRIAVSVAVVRTNEAELAQMMIAVRSDVRRAYFEAAIAEARLALINELQEFAARARNAAEQRFEAGSAPRLEMLQAQLTLAQAQNEGTGARAVLAAARVRLNALLALPLNAPAMLSTPLDEAPNLVSTTLIARAQTANAELAVLDRRIEEQVLRVALTRAMRVPDLVPEAMITRGAEPEFTTGWRAALGVTLPLLTTHRAGVQLEENTLAQLRREREATLARITGEVSAAVAQVDAQRQEYLRYRDEILPQALEVERMAEDSYRLGQTGITALLQALQASRDVRLQSLAVASQFQSTLADLERSLGAPLP